MAATDGGKTPALALGLNGGRIIQDRERVRLREVHVRDSRGSLRQTGSPRLVNHGARLKPVRVSREEEERAVARTRE